MFSQEEPQAGPKYLAQNPIKRVNLFKQTTKKARLFELYDSIEPLCLSCLWAISKLWIANKNVNDWVPVLQDDIW